MKETEMKRVNQIFFHPLYQEHFQMLQSAEENRVFCRHTLEHFLDVARLMRLYSLEEESRLSKEMIYATALLHDIGRFLQISENIPHEEAGMMLAGKICPECGFTEEETKQIQQAIGSHRNNKKDGEQAGDMLSLYLYRADKKSRCCFACAAQKECNWSQEKKNMQIEG